MERNYQNGKIYCIRNNIDDDIYVGSTTQSLSRRMSKHKRDINCKKREANKLYTKMRELGIEAFYIELVEEVKCDNVEQLRKREGELIRQMGKLNTRIECRTNKEYQKDNYDKLFEYRQQYYKDNIEKHTEYNKQYREEHKEELKERHKQYHQENRDNTQRI